MAGSSHDLGTGAVCPIAGRRYRRADCGPGGSNLQLIIDALGEQERIVSVYPTAVGKALWATQAGPCVLEALIEWLAP